MNTLFASATHGPGGEPQAPMALRKRQRQWRINPKLTPEGRERRELDALRRSNAFSPKGGAARNGAGRSRGGGGRLDDAINYGRSGNGRSYDMGGDLGRGGRGGGRGGRGRYDGGRGAYDGGRGAYAGGRGAYAGGGGRWRERDDARAKAREQVPSMPFLVRTLGRQKMVPAIVFIFSRVGCDEAAQAAAASAERLVSEDERALIVAAVDQFRKNNPDLPLDEERLKLLPSGVAAHHAGMLPLEKGLIEGLFQRALIKVVFATETLAAGVNMPARSTVISVISKRGDNVSASRPACRAMPHACPTPAPRLPHACPRAYPPAPRLLPHLASSAACRLALPSAPARPLPPRIMAAGHRATRPLGAASDGRARGAARDGREGQRRALPQPVRGRGGGTQPAAPAARASALTLFRDLRVGVADAEDARAERVQGSGRAFVWFLPRIAQREEGGGTREAGG